MAYGTAESFPGVSVFCIDIMNNLTIFAGKPRKQTHLIIVREKQFITQSITRKRKYRCLWQSGVVWREKIDSSAGKRTQGLSIKLWVLYQLSYQGIHVSPSKQLSHNIMTIWSWAPVALYMHQPPGGDFTCGRRVHLQLQGSSRLLGYVEKYRCLWQSGVVWREKLTPQPGNETGTSQLSFECSTNWATRESMFPPPNNLATISWPYGHELRWPYICTNLQVVTSPVVEEFIFN